MLGYPFYHGTIQKAIIAFGSLFSDIKIATVNGSGQIVNAMTVPIRYAGMDKTLAEPNPDASPYNEVYPRMSFEFSQLAYDAERKLNNNNIIKNIGAPTPYILGMDLNILSRNMTDALQIIEQIIPYFGPTLTLKMENSPFKGQEIDMPITLTAVSISDDYAGDEHEPRRLEIVLNFDVIISLFKGVGSEYDHALVDFIEANYDPDDPTTCTPPRKPLVPISGNGVIYRVDTNLYADKFNFCQSGIPDSTVTVEATNKEIREHRNKNNVKE